MRCGFIELLWPSYPERQTQEAHKGTRGRTGQEISNLKTVTTISIEADLIRMAKLNNINISKFVETALDDHLTQYNTPELKAINDEIKDLETKINNLQCKQSTISAERLNFRNFKKKFMDRQMALNKNWIQEAKGGRKEEVIAEIMKCTGIPRDWIIKILDDVTRQATS